jgi:hypothetical protein
MTNAEKFGTHGEALLVSRYCELYWEHNELQIIGTPAAITEACRLEFFLNQIVKTLGYTPAA